MSNRLRSKLSLLQFLWEWNSSCINFVQKLKEQKFSLCALNNHEKFFQFVFHNFVWSASLEKANARLLEELQEKELEYANLQEEVRDLNDKLNKARIQHSKELGTIGRTCHCKPVQGPSLCIVKVCRYYIYGLGKKCCEK